MYFFLPGMTLLVDKLEGILDGFSALIQTTEQDCVPHADRKCIQKAALSNMSVLTISAIYTEEKIY